MKYKKTTKGFTLIELLVVVAIIGILSSITIIALGRARDKAKIAKTQMMLSQLRTITASAQMNTNKILLDITGNDNSYDSCPVGQDLSTLNSAHACVVDWENAIDHIITSHDAKFSDGALYYKDAWGSPYLLDENEGEDAANPCIVNTLTSAGPNREAFDGDDITIILPYEKCS